jgi:hypothetical protein
MHHLIRNFDRSYLACDAFHADWFENIIQRNSDKAKVGLIVSDADAMVGISIYERYRYVARP